MIKVELSEKILDELICNLRKEDKHELIQLFPSSLDEFYNTCFEKEHRVYCLVTNESFPLAIGGAYPILNKQYKTAQVWLLTSDKLYENKIALYKYVIELIKEFKKEYDILFNFIYKSNFSSLKWLKALGFKVVDLKNQDYKLFYYCKGGNLDLRYFTS